VVEENKFVVFKIDCVACTVCWGFAGSGGACGNICKKVEENLKRQ